MRAVPVTRARSIANPALSRADRPRPQKIFRKLLAAAPELERSDQRIGRIPRVKHHHLRAGGPPLRVVVDAK
jgi:hypothetical protein